MIMFKSIFIQGIWLFLLFPVACSSLSNTFRCDSKHEQIDSMKETSSTKTKEVTSSAMQKIVDIESKCLGRRVEVFSQEDAADSVRSDPEHVVYQKNHLVRRVKFERCVEDIKGSMPKTPVRVGIETVELNNGVFLVVRNSGWETFSLQYRFILPELNQEIHDLAFWNLKAIELMRLATMLSERPATDPTDSGQESIAKVYTKECAEAFSQRIQEGNTFKPKESIVATPEEETGVECLIERLETLGNLSGRLMEIGIFFGPL